MEQSEKAIFNIRISTEVTCVGSYDAVKMLKENHRPLTMTLSRIPVDVSISPASSVWETSGVSKIHGVNVRVDGSNNIKCSVARLTLGEAKAAYDEMSGDEYLTSSEQEELWDSYGKEYVTEAETWVLIDEERSKALKLFKHVLAQPSSFEKIPKYEPDSLLERCEAVRKLYRNFAEAEGLIQDERNRLPWENTLSYYFLRYPELREMFSRMMRDGYDA